MPIYDFLSDGLPSAAVSSIPSTASQAPPSPVCNAQLRTATTAWPSFRLSDEFLAIRGS